MNQNKSFLNEVFNAQYSKQKTTLNIYCKNLNVAKRYVLQFNGEDKCFSDFLFPKNRNDIFSIKKDCSEIKSLAVFETKADGETTGFFSIDKICDVQIFPYDDERFTVTYNGTTEEMIINFADMTVGELYLIKFVGQDTEIKVVKANSKNFSMSLDAKKYLYGRPLTEVYALVLPKFDEVSNVDIKLIGKWKNASISTKCPAVSDTERTLQNCGRGNVDFDWDEIQTMIDYDY